MSQSEETSLPLTIHDDSTSQSGLHPPDPPSPPPSDPDHVAPDADNDLQEHLQNLDLKEEEKAEEDTEKKDDTDENGSTDDHEVDKLENENDSDKKNDARRNNYPLRPDAEDCAYYMKTGSCKFGSNCKFNHPVRRKNQGVKEKVKEKDESMENPGQTECKYYLRTGGCKFGKACRYNHSRAKTSIPPIIELNFLGLPIRLGEKECPYYMRNGSCKYGANCKFNHPDPTAAGASDPSGYGNGVPSQAASQVSIPSWSSTGTLNEAAAYVPMMFPPPQAVPPQNPEWNGYQAPVYPAPPERSMHPASYIIGNPSTEANFYARHNPQMLVDEYPERPGQPECSYFLKTGDCKFKTNCKFHHPKNRNAKPPTCTLSDKGLPLRPDQNICTHYSRYGICKFGPACKFDHPIQAPSAASGLDPSPPFGNVSATEEAGVAGTNGADSVLQQAV